jgi:hypothetical protein
VAHHANGRVLQTAFGQADAQRVFLSFGFQEVTVSKVFICCTMGILIGGSLAGRAAEQNAPAVRLTHGSAAHVHSHDAAKKPIDNARRETS